MRLAALILAGAINSANAQTTTPNNPAIDMRGFLRASSEAADARESRRVSEAVFIRMSREPGTIILDARSREKYNELHIKGAKHLSFPDIAVESLRAAIPDANTRILIYRNNNFQGATARFQRSCLRRR